MVGKSAPKPPPSADLPREEIEQRVKKSVERTLARNIPGLALPQTTLDLEVGLTPKDIAYTRDTLRLYHYRPLVAEVYRVPVLIVMSPVARGYILDLAKGQSFIEYLLLQGYDVYLMDWTAPRREHAHIGLKDFALDLIDESIAKVQEESGEQEITLLGYCMGGLLSVINAAMHPTGPIKNLVCFTTPVNAEGMALYKTWVDAEAFDIDLLVEQLGVIPGEMISASIQALRPFQKRANQMQLLNNVENDAFVKATLRFDRWATDQLPLPGALAREFVRDFLRKNLLIKNALKIDDNIVDISKIRVPFIHVAAEFDHIVPTAASSDLINLVGSEDKQEIVIRGGHVSLVAGGNAVYRLWPQLDRWLNVRSV